METERDENANIIKRKYNADSNDRNRENEEK